MFLLLPIHTISCNYTFVHNLNNCYDNNTFNKEEVF